MSDVRPTKTLVERLREALDGYWNHDRPIEPGIVYEAAQKLERFMVAAERVCWYDWSDNDEDAVKEIQGLQAVLGPVVTMVKSS